MGVLLPKGQGLLGGSAQWVPATRPGRSVRRVLWSTCGSTLPHGTAPWGVPRQLLGSTRWDRTSENDRFGTRVVCQEEEKSGKRGESTVFLPALPRSCSCLTRGKASWGRVENSLVLLEPGDSAADDLARQSGQSCFAGDVFHSLPSPQLCLFFFLNFFFFLSSETGGGGGAGHVCWGSGTVTHEAPGRAAAGRMREASPRGRAARDAAARRPFLGSASPGSRRLSLL